MSTNKEQIIANNTKIKSINATLNDTSKVRTPQTKTITPTTSLQTIMADSGKYLYKVVITAIESATQIPGVSGNGTQLTISDNFSSTYTNIYVNTPVNAPMIVIDSNNTIDLEGDGNEIICAGSNYTISGLENLVAENVKKDVSIGGVVGTYEGATSSNMSLNIAYGNTAPSDTTKLWLKCDEPESVEVKHTLSGSTINSITEVCDITNPVSDVRLASARYNTCYISDFKIAIVGYNHVRIFDINTASYTADYTVSVGTDEAYTNVLYKNGILYFGYNDTFYTYNLSTQTLSSITGFTLIKYIAFNTNDIITILDYSSGTNSSNIYYYTISTNTKDLYKTINTNKFSLINLYDNNKVIINNKFYQFFYSSDNAGNYFYKINLLTGLVEDFTSLDNFVKSKGWEHYRRQSIVYDNVRYVYLTGGTYKTSVSSETYNMVPKIIRYDVLSDSFQELDNQLLGVKENHFSLLIDGKIYIFGGNTDRGGTRTNKIDCIEPIYKLDKYKLAIISNDYMLTPTRFNIINTISVKMNININNAFIGITGSVAKQVDMYYHDGTNWNKIN